MANLINFILESTLWLVIFYLTYQIFLQRIKWPVFTRFFLLGGLVFSFVLPLVHLDIWQTQLPAIIINVGEAVENVSRDTIVNTNGNESGTNFSLPFIIYLSIAAILFIYFSISLLQVYFYKKNPEQLPQNLLAFSFFNFIYLHPQLKLQEDSDLILNHENAHASQWHSFDILLLQLIRVAFWANPVLWIYHIPMRENHEYLADQAVLQKCPKRAIQYQQLILKLQLNSLSPALVNNFNFFSYKKRITMINKKKITAFKKGYLLISVVAFLLSVVACKSFIENIEPQQVYSLAELDFSPVRYEGTSQIYDYIRRNAEYPSVARKNDVYGKYFISFTADEEGWVYDVAISKHNEGNYLLPEIILVGYGLNAPEVSKLGLKDMETDLTPQIPKKDREKGEQAMIRSLQELMVSFPQIKPVVKNGKPVKVRMVLPIEYKLWPI